MSFFISTCVPGVGFGLLCLRVCSLGFLYCTSCFLYCKCLQLNLLPAWSLPHLSLSVSSFQRAMLYPFSFLLPLFFCLSPSLFQLSPYKIWRVCWINCQIKKGKYWLLSTAQENWKVEAFSVLLTLFSSQRLCLCGKDDCGTRSVSYTTLAPGLVHWIETMLRLPHFDMSD